MPRWHMLRWHTGPRRALFSCLLGLMLGLGLSGLAGCGGWAPLYADPQTGPADEELRAIRVAPVPERIGQRLALALRESLNPAGEPARQRYILRATLQVARLDLGIQTQGLGTRGRLDVYANFILSDSTSGTQLLNSTSHVAESFDILANLYSDTVAEDDARTRAVEELRRDIVSRLTLFLQRRTAEGAARPVGAGPVGPKPGTP
jgi:LPS-assembly lipoprotein